MLTWGEGWHNIVRSAFAVLPNAMKAAINIVIKTIACFILDILK